MKTNSELLTINEASEWATSLLNKKVTPSNITYLIQYGRVQKIGENGATLVNRNELEEYYKKQDLNKEQMWKNKLGDDLNWSLSFAGYKESETTKHVHRLHPYKGKFIPQLVEYFLDSHVDKFKTKVFFKEGDIVLDPFCGSGTTLVQANELGINAIGIDISQFNSNISNAKICSHDLNKLDLYLSKIIQKLKSYVYSKNYHKFEKELLSELKTFNDMFFPAPDYRFKVRRKEINEKEYSIEKEQEFLPIYTKLIKKYNIELKQKTTNSFIDKWFLQIIRNEIEVANDIIECVEDVGIKTILQIILSRTVRSCRATTHSDLATLKEPIINTYYCKKHGKICKPIFSILGWFERYSKDTVNRLKYFSNLRTNTFQYCLCGDSRNINIIDSINNVSSDFGNSLSSKKIDGIFASPPYVGLIDYHEQHAYAYDLFGFKRQDDSEIGPLFKGQGIKARNSYVQGISDVLVNCKKFMKKDYNVFLVANDKHNLYPMIAEQAGMKIINEYKRPVLNRVEKDRGNAYSEIIFHMQEK